MRLPSAILRLSITQAVIFILLACIFALSSLYIAQHIFEEILKAEIESDIHSITKDAARFPVVGPLSVIDHYLSRDTGAAIYLLKDPQGLFGNLQDWPNAEADHKGWIKTHATLKNGDRCEILARQILIQGQYPLLVGRELSPFQSLFSDTLLLLMILTSIAIAAGIGLGYATGRVMLRHLSNLNDVFVRFAKADTGVRAPSNTGARELDDLAMQINRALEHNEQLMNSLRHLTDRVAHELRRPLSHLLREVRGLEDQKLVTTESLEAIENSMASLQSIFNALLEVAQLEAGIGGTMSYLDLADCADHALELYTPMAAEKSVTIKKDVESVTVYGIFPLLVHCFANLIDNALKFTPPASHIGVKIGIEADKAVFAVEDEGAGCATTPLSAIFDRFTRDPVHRAVKGHGLGLALVKAIAIRHGGTVSAENLSPGFRVQVTLPRYLGADKHIS